MRFGFDFYQETDAMYKSCSTKCQPESVRASERVEPYHDDALAEMIDGGSPQDRPSVLDAPIVVIGGDFLEGEVFYAEGPKHAQEPRLRRRRRLAAIGGGGGAAVGGDGER